MRRLISALAAFVISIFSPSCASANETDAGGDPTESWAAHAQVTFIEQYHPAFRSPYRGTNSLDPGSRGDETVTATAFLGVRPWNGAEIWINPEIDQGFGLSNTVGLVGFPNGEGAKVGEALPYPKLPRLFLRQTMDLGGDLERVDPDVNQLAGTQTHDRLVITLGKLSVADVFDHNSYADDARNYFLNWTLVDLGSFDYAANAWGYTYGAAVEWYQGPWAARAGLFDLSAEPNSAHLEETFGRQFQLVGELEEDHSLFGHEGKVRLLSFFSHGRMGLFSDAIALAQSTHQPANTALVRHLHERAGFGLTLEQQLTDDIGLFVRAGYSDPSRESFEFTDVDRAISGGLAVNGESWSRKNDTFAIALSLNDIGSGHAAYFNAGGLGILAGDGKLPHPGDEFDLESYYKLAVNDWLAATADYQLFINPAYNEDRGPVSVLGARINAGF